jgi:hypothetical protein
MDLDKRLRAKRPEVATYADEAFGVSNYRKRGVYRAFVENAPYFALNDEIVLVHRVCPVCYYVRGTRYNSA